MLRPIEDDREQHPADGDRVLLIIEDDLSFARIMLGLAHENGYKAVVATRGDSGLALANQLKPDAISLDMQLPVLDGWRVLDRLKRNPGTRHIPVHVISVDELTRRGAALGAFAYLEKPVSREALQGAFQHISTFLDRSVRQSAAGRGRRPPAREHRRAGERGRRRQGHGRAHRRGGAGGARVGRSSTAWSSTWCYPATTACAWSRQVKTQPRFRDLPIIVYTGKELTPTKRRRA